MAGDLLPETREAVFDVLLGTTPRSSVRPVLDVLAALLADPAARAALAKELLRVDVPGASPESEVAVGAVLMLGSHRLVADVNRAAVAAGEAPPGMEVLTRGGTYFGPGDCLYSTDGRRLFVFRLAPEDGPDEK